MKALPTGEALSGLSFPSGGDGPETLWSPIVQGDTIGVEISLPSAHARSSFSFSIEEISHIDSLIESITFEPRRLNCFTHIDVQCAQGRFPQTQADAVASILFEDDEGTFVCTGTLLNDTLDDTFIPYFLTAKPLRVDRNGCAHRGGVVVLSARSLRPRRDRRAVHQDLRRCGPAGSERATGRESAAPEG